MAAGTFRGDRRQKERGGVCGAGSPKPWLVSKLNLVCVCICSHIYIYECEYVYAYVHTDRRVWGCNVDVF